ncbi:MAG: hypothetical protein ACOX5R_19680 [bacterium]
MPIKAFIAHDMDGNLTFLSDGDWRLKFVAEKWEQIVFHKTCEHR